MDLVDICSFNIHAKTVKVNITWLDHSGDYDVYSSIHILVLIAYLYGHSPDSCSCTTYNWICVDLIRRHLSTEKYVQEKITLFD